MLNILSSNELNFKKSLKIGLETLLGLPVVHLFMSPHSNEKENSAWALKVEIRKIEIIKANLFTI